MSIAEVYDLPVARRPWCRRSRRARPTIWASLERMRMMRDSADRDLGPARL